MILCLKVTITIRTQSDCSGPIWEYLTAFSYGIWNMICCHWPPSFQDLPVSLPRVILSRAESDATHYSQYSHLSAEGLDHNGNLLVVHPSKGSLIYADASVDVLTLSTTPEVKGVTNKTKNLENSLVSVDPHSLTADSLDDPWIYDHSKSLPIVAYLKRCGRPYCRVCNSVCSSDQHLAEHLSGKKHARKMQSWRGLSSRSYIIPGRIHAEKDGFDPFRFYLI